MPIGRQPTIVEIASSSSGGSGPGSAYLVPQIQGAPVSGPPSASGVNANGYANNNGTAPSNTGGTAGTGSNVTPGWDGIKRFRHARAEGSPETARHHRQKRQPVVTRQRSEQKRNGRSRPQ